MRRRVSLAAIVLALAVGATTTASAANGLGPRLTTSLVGPSLSLGKTAALAVDVATGETIYEHNSDVPFAPASNEKLPVSYAALVRLGPGYRFHTEVYGTGSRAGATWNGNLVLKGFGDPTLGSADIERLAATIRGRGIRTVTGRVLGDESFYDRKRAAAGWKPGFLGGETPPLSALIVDDARGWPALSPPLLAARALRDALERRGVAVVGRHGLGVAPATATTLASDTSEPLSRARAPDEPRERQLLRGDAPQATRCRGGRGRDVGRRQQDRDRHHEGGRDTRVGRQDRRRIRALEPRSAHGDHARRRSPSRATDPTIARPFLASLAVSGSSGTLSTRLPSLRGKVKGKTGTTNLACTLSGVIQRRIVFAVLENGNPVSSWSARAAQDRFVTILATTAPAG